ncbi:hypothetical protein [Belnapia moabensis]|uniref:hypothetical protein n=1 Tax=Belnapia moabensis TaxID=365533 RepID=UPI0005B942F7|nr:hypothetical protein [Belnapia moabensis]
MATPRLRVELDIFSGRPNPSWVLDVAEEQALLAHLRLGAGCEPRSDGLGYRGFLVRRMDMSAAAGPWLRVGHGVVMLSGPRAVAHRDAGRLEEHLIGQAVAHGFGPLVGVPSPTREDS